MKRIIALFIVLILSIIPALADTIGDVMPVSSVWGTSREGFTSDSGYKLKKATVGKSDALKRSKFDLESYNMDGYYIFSANFKTHKGLSKIAYILNNSRGLTSQEINDCKASMIDAMTRLVGQPTSVSSSVATWKFPGQTVEIGAGTFKNYVGNTKKTVGIIIKGENISTASGQNVYSKSKNLNQYQLALRQYMFNPPYRSQGINNFINGLYTIGGLSYQSGDNGEAVTELQNLLIGAGFLNAGEADGSYGKNTVNAVTSFQSSCGLSNTGLIDLPTQFMLVMNNANYQRKDSCFIAQSGKYAVVIWPMKAIYIGLLNGKGAFSSGTYFYTNNEYYAGSFKNGLRSGQGKARFSNGDIYIGQWENDQMNGKGKYYFGGEGSNEYYDGEMSNNEMSGKGTYWQNGKQISGTWAKNRHKSWK